MYFVRLEPIGHVASKKISNKEVEEIPVTSGELAASKTYLEGVASIPIPLATGKTYVGGVASTLPPEVSGVSGESKVSPLSLKTSIHALPKNVSVIMLEYLSWRDWLTMFSVSTRLKDDCDFMMGHNILPKDCVRIPGKKGGHDTGKDIIVTRWIYEKMSNYGCNKTDISDLIIELLFEDRRMTLRRRLADHWFLPRWATTLFFDAIENGDPYGDCDSDDELRYKRVILLAETLKWKVLSRNPKYDNFSTFYANDDKGLTWSTVAVEESDGEESDGGEEKSCSKSFYTDSILETFAMRKIVDSIVSREIERDRFRKSAEGQRAQARAEEAERKEREREQSEIDRIRQQMIRKYGGKQNKTARRKARKILRERHERVCGSVEGRAFCEICGSHTICTKCWTCVPWNSCCQRQNTEYSFRDQYHLHGLHHNMKYYDKRSDYYASDVHIDE